MNADEIVAGEVLEQFETEPFFFSLRYEPQNKLGTSAVDTCRKSMGCLSSDLVHVTKKLRFQRGFIRRGPLFITSVTKD